MALTPLLRSLKAYEGNGAFLVFQVSAFTPGSGAKAIKLHLIVDANQRTAGIRAQDDKPDDLKAAGAFVAQLRKHAKSGGIGPILRDRATSDWWLPLYTSKSGAPDFYIHLAHAAPPELRLIARDKTIMVRRSTQGSFTKRRTHEGDLPDIAALPEHFEDVTAAVLHDLLNASAAAEEAPAPDPQEHQQLPDYQRDARDRVSRKLKTVRKFAQRIEGETPKPLAIQEAERDAELLKSYLYRVREGMESLDVDGIKVELDPEKSPGHNLERAYTQVKKLRRAREVGIVQTAKAQSEVKILEDDLAKLRAGLLSFADAATILVRHKLPLAKQEAPHERAGPGEKVALPFRTYGLAEGATTVEILVGKSARDNDELCKGARSNDWWLHAVGVTGSHVIIPARQLKGEPSLALLRHAAILALHFSQIRTDCRGEVYVTKRHLIRKKKGMPPGLWNIDQAETMFVKYDEAEIQTLLDKAKL